MKKNVLIIILLFLAVFIGRVVWLNYLNQPEIVQLCSEDDSCCLDSLKMIKQGDYILANDGNCPDDYVANSFYCPGALTWCEPKSQE